MLKWSWWKGTLLVLGGTVFGLGLAGGCGGAVLQRLLVSLAFD
jgi:hypothetical protein